MPPPLVGRFSDFPSPQQQALEAQDMGKSPKPLGYGLTHWAILVQGWHSAVERDSGTANAMADEPR